MELVVQQKNGSFPTCPIENNMFQVVPASLMTYTLLMVSHRDQY